MTDKLKSGWISCLFCFIFVRPIRSLGALNWQLTSYTLGQHQLTGKKSKHLKSTPCGPANREIHWLKSLYERVSTKNVSLQCKISKQENRHCAISPQNDHKTDMLVNTQLTSEARMEPPIQALKRRSTVVLLAMSFSLMLCRQNTENMLAKNKTHWQRGKKSGLHSSFHSESEKYPKKSTSNQKRWVNRKLCLFFLLL